MGERGKRALQVNFDGKLKLEFHGATISSDALFDNPDIYEFFKEESYCYAIRLKGNNLLH